jgi:hypothetical protein
MDGLLLCQLNHELNAEIISPAEFMELLAYRYEAFHYAALDLGCVFVAQFKSVRNRQVEDTVLYTYNEKESRWELEMTDSQVDENAA